MTEHEAAPKGGKFGGAGALKPAMPVIAVVCVLLAL